MPLSQALVRELSESIVVISPGASEDQTLFYARQAITINRMRAVKTGGTSITWTIRHDPDRSATGTEVITGGTATTNGTTGDDLSEPFNGGMIPAGSWIWLETTAKGGNPNELAVTIFYTQD